MLRMAKGGLLERRALLAFEDQLARRQLERKPVVSSHYCITNSGDLNSFCALGLVWCDSM